MVFTVPLLDYLSFRNLKIVILEIEKIVYFFILSSVKLFYVWIII